MSRDVMLSQPQSDAPALGSIFLVVSGDGGSGYAATNDRQYAEALTTVGFMQVSREDYERVKARVDAKSGIADIVQEIRRENLQTGMCSECGGKLFADGSCSDYECELHD